MSGPGADVPLSLDGEALLAAVDVSVFLPRSVLSDAVALAAAEPLEFCVSSVINDGAARVFGAWWWSRRRTGSTEVARGRAHRKRQGKQGGRLSTLDGGTGSSVATDAGRWSDVSSAREC